MERSLSILGTRGVPAAHGGFETFAEHLSRHMCHQGWRVTVYCQEQGARSLREDEWEGVRRVRIAVPGDGALSTILFDWFSTLHALKEPSLKLVLGYNTALFSLLYRVRGRVSLMNMDGLEWRRAKWGWLAKTWFYLNERFGCWFSNRLVADHPAIAEHLATRVCARKIETIPYGATEPDGADVSVLGRWGLQSGSYALVVARAEPENSLLEIVQAFAARQRTHRLVVLGDLSPDHPYHQRVLAAANESVIFAGAIYDAKVVGVLRVHAALYVHGHQVGGTNPSLVEALAAGSPVLAHDNSFNRWVAGGAARYFLGATDCAKVLDEMLLDEALLQRLGAAATARHAEAFTWQRVLAQYESVIDAMYASGKRGAA